VLEPKAIFLEVIMIFCFNGNKAFLGIYGTFLL